MSRWARSLAASASAWAVLTISSAAGLGVLPGLVEKRPDAVVGLGHQLAVLGQELLALVAGLLGLEHVLEMLLALVQGLRRAASRRTS